jgi:nucleoside-diphosphate-sugar epimerase
VSLVDFITICEQLIGKPAITHNVPTPRSEPLITYADNTLAREVLDFDPRVDVQEGMSRTWAWYRENHKT